MLQFVHARAPAQPARKRSVRPILAFTAEASEAADTKPRATLVGMNGVCKVFSSRNHEPVAAIDDINLDLPESSITLVSGPSGSGKTTLLGIIGCMMRPSAGRVSVGGRDVTRLSEDLLAEMRRRYIGFIFQNRYAVRRASALENVMLPGLTCRQHNGDLRDRARSLLAEVGLDAKAHHRVEHLSGGEQQRVALARALINDPQVIIADEPTSHLDSSCSDSFSDLVGALRQHGKSAIIASHDPRIDGSGLFTHHVSLSDGRMEAGRWPCS